MVSILRVLALLGIICIGAWALRPPSSAREGEEASSSGASERAFTIRMAPGIYMPGRRPMDLGEPLSGLREVAREFEKLHPDTRIEFVDAPVGMREWLVTQLSAEQAPEILNVNVEDVWQDVQKGWYVPLDQYLEAPNRFISKGEAGSEQWWDLFKYQSVSRGKAAPDGKMYCLTFDMIETAIFYNKEIFAKLGLEPPRDWNEFIQIQERIKTADYIPMLVHISSLADWGFDLLFDQLYNELLPAIDLKQDPQREAYLQGYLDWDELCFLNSKGFFTKRDPRFSELFRILKEWRRYMPKDMSTVDNTKLFVQQKAAMYWNSSLLVNRLARDPDVGFEWGVFYLPPIPSSYSQFANGSEMVVIGGSGTQFEVTNSAFDDTGDPKTSKKLERCIAFLQFLTVPRNAEKVVNELMTFLPNIVGVEPHEELLPFHDILLRRYTTTKWMFSFDLRFSDILQRMLSLYLADGISHEGFMQWMENNVQSSTATLARRKSLDLSIFEAEWARREALLQQVGGLPE